MKLVAAKCPSCGADIQADEGKDAGICPYCGAAYVTEKAIGQTVINAGTVTNIQTQQNVYYGAGEFQKEKNQCKVLLMLLNNMDLQYLKERALRVLDVNPDNSLAQMIYDCDFGVENYEGFVFLNMKEGPLLTYLRKELGNIDAETCLTFITALVLEAQTDSRVQDIVRLILQNLVKLGLSEAELCKTLDQMAGVIADVGRINEILYSSKLSKISGVLGIFTNSYDTASNFSDAAAAKRLAGAVLDSRVKIASVFRDEVRKAQLPEERRRALIAKVSPLLGGAVQGGTEDRAKPAGAADRPQASGGGAKRGLGAVFIVLGIVFLICVLVGLFISGMKIINWSWLITCFVGIVFLFTGVEMVRRKKK